MTVKSNTLVSATTIEAFLETDLAEEEEEDRDRGKGMRLLLPQKKCDDRWNGEI